MTKPTAAIGHMPFKGHRTMAQIAPKPFVSRAFRPAYVERAPRNRDIGILDTLVDEALARAYNQAQLP